MAENIAGAELTCTIVSFVGSIEELLGCTCEGEDVR